jgi:hypothetical protein
LETAADRGDIVVWLGPEGERRVTRRRLPDLRALLRYLDGEMDASEERLEIIKGHVREVRGDD